MVLLVISWATYADMHNAIISSEVAGMRAMEKLVRDIRNNVYCNESVFAVNM